MLRIRLRRVGAKKQPSYRVVVAESTSPRDGKFVEAIGFYNPRTEPATVKLEEARALHWLSVGAQPSEAVARLLRNNGTMARFARLKDGESLEALVEEAEAVEVVAEPEPEPEPIVAEEVEQESEAEAEPEPEPELEPEPEPESDSEEEVEAAESEE